MAACWTARPLPSTKPDRRKNSAQAAAEIAAAVVDTVAAAVVEIVAAVLVETVAADTKIR